MSAAGQTTATVDIDTTTTTPVHPGFSGVNADLGFPVEYWDYRFNALAAKINYGWVRFPGGSSSDIYNWQTGEEIADWFAQFAGGTAGPSQNVIPLVAGRGGAKLIDAANRANLLGASLIVCVNGFTDSPQSAGQLTAFVKANNISVAAWELSNEAYLFPDFFADATTYLDKMKPYRDAIKAVDPNAIVSIFVRDPGNAGSPQSAWDQAIASYAGKYWDAITFHYYPPQSTGDFAQWMADESAVLAAKTNTLVTDQLTPIGPPGVKFLNTEFDPSIPNDSKTGASSITDGTLWGGIYTAEYIMRMSTVPAMLFTGPNEISFNAGVSATNGNQGQVMAAANAGKPIDTLSLNFGFYTTAQAAGESVLNGVINRAVQSNKTTISGGATVPATGMASIPALFAMSYSNASGGLSTVITNKSATTHQVTIRVNSAAATGTFPLQFVTATDPSSANSGTNPNTITVQTGSSANPVTVPPYSVLRADIVTPPIAVIVNSASYRSAVAAPQQLVTAFGSGFSSQTLQATSQPLPPALGDTNIVIADSKGTSKTAPLLYVSANQASFLIPDGLAPGTATAKVMRGGNPVLTGTLNIGAVSPGLYSANGNGAGVAAATAFQVDASGASTPLVVFSCQSGIPLSCLSSPLSVGDSTDTLYVSLYGTGIRGAKSVQAFVAGQPVQVLFSGAQGQYAGLDQVNISVPRGLAGTGEASVYLIADGQVSNMTTVKIQ